MSGGRKMAVGDVDRDALLALGAQAVGDQREIEVPAAGPMRARIGLERRELVVEQRPRLMEQPADQRRLAVVDAAADDQTDERPCRMRLQNPIGLRERGLGAVAHQKYPSRFFSSMDDG